MENIVLILFTILVITIVSLTIYILLKQVSTGSQPTTHSEIYCIMITGKDYQRIEYAKKAVTNFMSQDYPHDKRKLLIINHNMEYNVLETETEGIYEFKVNKEKNSLTLGDLRNIALQMVPINAYWTTWDDDDYRAPEYLSTLARAMDNMTIVVITKRLEYNINNKLSWECTDPNGLVFFLAPFDNRVKYLSLESLEDKNILSDFASHGYKIKAISNNPNIYVRLVHQNNTSTFVDSNRNYLYRGKTYYDKFTNQSQKDYINNISAFWTR